MIETRPDLGQTEMMSEPIFDFFRNSEKSRLSRRFIRKSEYGKLSGEKKILDDYGSFGMTIGDSLGVGV